ncbi:hypothetical protein EJ08DRAFT_654067 [Tothia fuscella]|uniref:Uncharacterized protein n=1 Tax=Tothia fuscella TaxID=1048955 RepID=A0A9P4NFF7_9PEZI|nr:hypothetical protein EJ08DRAFT_654067 [Tothia fuscella]
MSLITTTCTSYTGALSDLPSNSTPSLHFLTFLFQAYDSITDPEAMESLVSPSALIHLNANPPSQRGTATPEKQKQKWVKRSSAIKSISRDLSRAWDIETETGRRTVIFESLVKYVFVGDETKENVVMAEMGIVKLERVPNGMEGYGKGVGGYWMTELRTCHDPQNIKKKREELGC